MRKKCGKLVQRFNQKEKKKMSSRISLQPGKECVQFYRINQAFLRAKSMMNPKII